MMKWLLVSGLVCIGTLASSGPSEAGSEWVYVSEVLSDGDQAIIIRRSGESYLIEKGIGCLSLWRSEGKQVLVTSPGLFLGVGSELVLPDQDQQCRIWSAEALDIVRPQDEPREPTSSPVEKGILAVQSVLTRLGYDPGSVDGVWGPKTETALRQFQEAVGLPATGRIDQQTAQALAGKLGAPQTSGTTALRPSSGCVEGHWVSQVMAGGGVVELEDGSLWQIDPVDKIDSMLWLPPEAIIACDSALINTDTGDRVSAVRVR
jgi:hypothetical protein